jgi:hypothetical protein
MHKRGQGPIRADVAHLRGRDIPRHFHDFFVPYGHDSELDWQNSELLTVVVGGAIFDLYPDVQGYSLSSFSWRSDL